MLCADLYQRINATRGLLLMVGLWPYQQSKFTRIQQLLTCGILSSFILFQFTSLMTTKCTPYFVMKVFSSALLFINVLLLYNAFWFHNSHVKYLLEQIEHICYKLKNRTEISIIDKYALNAKRKTITVVVIGILFLILLHPMWPHILDRFLLTNGTNSHHVILIVTEYFVDQEKYYYVIMLHMYATCCICMFAVVGTGTILIVYFAHACGMFQIVSYRIKQAMEIDTRQNIKQESRSIEQETTIFKGIVLAVDIHRKALNFCELTISEFKTALCLMTIFGVICLSLNMFQIFQIVTFGGKTEEIFLHLAYVIPIVVYMFSVNYLGQEITDHNSNIFLTAYNVRWYMAPLSIQKLILFLLQKGNKPYVISAAGIFVASLEFFVKLTNASLSYFTVMYSIQE